MVGCTASSGEMGLSTVMVLLVLMFKVSTLSVEYCRHVALDQVQVGLKIGRIKFK